METKDSLGDRMKRQYEDRTRFMLPRRTFAILRADDREYLRSRIQPQTEILATGSPHNS